MCILEMYLEELSDHIEDVSVECQTDMFLDKPATPLFIPAKTGRDAATQIEEGEVQYGCSQTAVFAWIFFWSVLTPISLLITLVVLLHLVKRINNK